MTSFDVSRKINVQLVVGQPDSNICPARPGPVKSFSRPTRPNGKNCSGQAGQPIRAARFEAWLIEPIYHQNLKFEFNQLTS